MGKILNREETENPNKVLVIEPDASDLFSLKKLLVDQLDLECVEVASAAEAFEHLCNSKFGLIVTEYSLPDLSGFDLLSKLRECKNNKSVPVIITSNESTTENVQVASQLSASDFFKKPIEPELLKVRAMELLSSQEPILDIEKKILIADDVPSARRIVEAFLKRLGFEHVFSAGNGKEALGILAKQDVDVVLMDWDMPVMTGLEFLKFARKTKKLEKLPILIMSTYSEQEYFLEAAENLANGFLIKPFDKKVLRRKLSHFLKK